MTVTEFLKDHVPFLKGLQDNQVAYLAQGAQQVSFKKGQTILFKGVSVEGLHVIAQGKASVHAKIDPGKPLQRVAELGPGDVFGEMSILDFCMAGATIKCEANDTLLFVIHQDLFRKLIEADPTIKGRVEALIASRKAGPKKEEDPKPADPAAPVQEQAPPKPAG